MILSRYYNAYASMDFINGNRMGLADETVYFISFSSFVSWRLACGLFFLGVLFPFEKDETLMELNQKLSLKIELWNLFARNKKVTRQGTNNFLVIIGTVLNFVLDVALNLHKFARFLYTIHLLVKFIVDLWFIVAIWFDLVDSICMSPELVQITFLKKGYFYFSFYFSFTKQTFPCSKSTIATVEQCVKHVKN